MEVKIRAFLAAGMRGWEVMGRNSATGSPRRSITMTPPSAASRTSSEVWIWSSRTEVLLTCYIVAHCFAGSRGQPDSALSHRVTPRTRATASPETRAPPTTRPVSLSPPRPVTTSKAPDVRATSPRRRVAASGTPEPQANSALVAQNDRKSSSSIAAGAADATGNGRRRQCRAPSTSPRRWATTARSA